MRLDRGSTVCSMMSSRSTMFHKVGTNIDAFINLPTLNYILAGIQLCYRSEYPDKSKWFELLYDLDKYHFSHVGKQLTLWDLRYITRELIVPFGIARGSEKQGGQDEVGLSAATWPVNFVTNLVLDGHERNVVNYWHYHDVSAGDDLVFRLKPMPLPRGKHAYTLNHYYKGFVQQNFDHFFQPAGMGLSTHVWQLVPDLFSLEKKVDVLSPGSFMMPGFEVPEEYVWQEHGYWHVGRSQVMSRKYATKEYYNDDMANQLKVNHMEMTFEPTFCKAPGEPQYPRDAKVVKYDPRFGSGIVPNSTDIRDYRPVVAPGLASEAWEPSLMLEQFAPMPLKRPASAMEFGRDIAVACGLAAMAPAAFPNEPAQPLYQEDLGAPAFHHDGLAAQPLQHEDFAAQPPSVEAHAPPSLEQDLAEISSVFQAEQPEAVEPVQGAFGSILSAVGGGRGKGKKKQQAAPELASMPMQE
jgi:hypothetical protein